jgi:hypothetical protein
MSATPSASGQIFRFAQNDSLREAVSVGASLRATRIAWRGNLRLANCCFLICGCFVAQKRGILAMTRLEAAVARARLKKRGGAKAPPREFRRAKIIPARN